MTETQFNRASAEDQRKVLNGIIKHGSRHTAETRRKLQKHDRQNLFHLYINGLSSIERITEEADDIIDAYIAIEKARKGDTLPAPMPMPTPAPEQPLNDAEAKLKALQDIIGTGGTVDAEQVKQIINEELEKRFIPSRVQIVIPDKPAKPANIQHKLFPRIVQLATVRTPTLLVGEAGSGKTHTAQSVAAELDLPFYSISCCSQTTQSQFFGYKSITTGEYVTTDFYDAFTGGGVFLFDEMDACNTSTMLAVNSAIANRFCAFPNGNQTAHPDFIVIAGANTFGGGADKRYTGRQRLDRASTDRFVKLRFDYDDNLERALALNIKPDADQWVTLVQSIRVAVEELKIDILVSPRTTLKGAELLNLGWTEKEALESLCFAGVEDHTVKKIMSIAA